MNLIQFVRGRVRWWLAQRYVSLERFDQEHRAYVAAESRYMALREWIETKRNHESDRPNYARLAKDAWEYAAGCVPLRKRLPKARR